MNKIKELREALGLSQKALAIDIKVSQPTVSAWESGLKVMSNKSAAKLADYFHVSIDYLLGRSSQSQELKKPTVVDDGLRSYAIERVSALSDPELARVMDFLAGLEAGQEIGAAPAADRDSDAGSSE